MFSQQPGYRDYYILYRMIPPGKLDYFFSVGYSNEIEKGKQKDYRHLLDDAAPIRDSYDEKSLEYLLGVQGEKPLIYKCDEFTLEVPKFNYIEGGIDQINKIITLVDIKKMKALPRPEKDSTQRPKTPWTFTKSFFIRHPPFFEDTYAKCFDFDWNCGKIEKWLAGMPKEHRDSVYDYLKSNYRQM
jgi:hypothetical protein